MRVVGCFLEHDNTFALLKRHAYKPDGSTWGLPAGKVEPKESDESAIIRELYEETGYRSDASELDFLGVYTFVMPSGITNDFVTYRVRLREPHELILENAAHSEYIWISAEEAYQMSDLIFGLHELLTMVGLVTIDNQQ